MDATGSALGEQHCCPLPLRSCCPCHDARGWLPRGLKTCSVGKRSSIGFILRTSVGRDV